MSRAPSKAIRFIVSLLASFVALAAIRSPLPAQIVALDADLAALVHKLVVESVNGGGRHPSQVFVAADSISAAIMRVAEIPADSTRNLTCPGSSDANGGVPTGPLGYMVKLRVNGEGDSREVSVFKACTFVYRGAANGFYQGEDYEVKREHGRWRVARLLRGVIT